MLKAELDIEIIKSALLAGEVDDAMSWIQKAKHKMVVYKKITKKTKYDARYRFIESLESFLRGEIDIDDLRTSIQKIPDVRGIFVEPEEFDLFLDGFLYDIGLAVDRYNVRYPSFDGKRCDDK